MADYEGLDVAPIETRRRRADEYLRVPEITPEHFNVADIRKGRSDVGISGGGNSIKPEIKKTWFEKQEDRWNPILQKYGGPRAIGAATALAGIASLYGVYLIGIGKTAWLSYAVGSTAAIAATGMAPIALGGFFLMAGVGLISVGISLIKDHNKI